MTELDPAIRTILQAVLVWLLYKFNNKDKQVVGYTQDPVKVLNLEPPPEVEKPMKRVRRERGKKSPQVLE